MILSVFIKIKIERKKSNNYILKEHSWMRPQESVPKSAYPCCETLLSCSPHLSQSLLTVILWFKSFLWETFSLIASGI